MTGSPLAGLAEEMIAYSGQRVEPDGPGIAAKFGDSFLYFHILPYPSNKEAADCFERSTLSSMCSDSKP